MAGNVPTLIAERSGANTYTVRSAGGAELRIGAPGAAGTFSPVELLQAAIAGCASLSAEAQLATRLGDAFDATTTVEAVYDGEANLVEKLMTTIAADTSQLDPAQHDRLISSAERIIDKLCTVKRTLDAGVEAVTEVERRDS